MNTAASTNGASIGMVANDADSPEKGVGMKYYVCLNYGLALAVVFLILVPGVPGA